MDTSCWVPPAGFEPAHTAPEAVALSPELRGRVRRVRCCSRRRVEHYQLARGGHERVFAGRDGARAGPCHPRRAEVGKTRTRWPVRTYSRVVPRPSGRILVVDDNKVIRQLIRVNLELEGFEVVTAGDGAECLEVVQQVRPDAVTLDVVMPRLDGLRTAARLRADPRTRDLPIAIVSACTQYEVDAGSAAGADAFLSKPFEPAELVGLVRQLVERKGSGSTVVRGASAQA